MDDDVQRLRAWQIKDFPEEKRRLVIAQAQAAGQTVAQWLEPLIDSAFTGQVNRANLPSPPPSAAVSHGMEELRELAALARALTPEDRDSAAMRKARSIVLRRLKALEQGSAPLMIGSDR